MFRHSLLLRIFHLVTSLFNRYNFKCLCAEHPASLCVKATSAANSNKQVYSFQMMFHHLLGTGVPQLVFLQLQLLDGSLLPGFTLTLELPCMRNIRDRPASQNTIPH